MTNHKHNSPDTNHDRPQVDRLRSDRRRCDCGATADRDGRCRKCRARAAWACRTAGRRSYEDRPSLRRVPRSRHARRTAEPLIGRCCRAPRRDEGIEL